MFEENYLPWVIIVGISCRVWNNFANLTPGEDCEHGVDAFSPSRQSGVIQRWRRLAST